MCIVSAVMDRYSPFIPQPQTWPTTGNLQRQIDELKALLEAFRLEVKGAEEFDRITGHPDCVDPEKAKLMERVEQLESKIKRLENGLAEFDFDCDISGWDNRETGEQVTPEQVAQEILNLYSEYIDILMDHLFEKNYKVTVVTDALHNED